MLHLDACSRIGLPAALLLGACAGPAGSGLPVSTEAYADVQTYEQHSARLQHFELPVGRLAYVDEGQGPVVVLVHGIPTSSWMYRKVTAQLVEDGYRVIAPDLLGLGSSSREADELLTVEAQAEHLAALLVDHLSLENWIHVVHDFGGPITWELMEDPRCSIRRLVILDTFAFDRGWQPELNGVTKVAMELGMSGAFDDAFYALAIRGMVAQAEVATDFMLRGYCAPMVAGGDAAYRCLYYASNELLLELPRYQETLRAYRGRDVHLVWGRHDEFLSATDQLEQFAELLEVPSDRIEIVEDASHLVADEAPEAVVRAVVDR